MPISRTPEFWLFDYLNLVDYYNQSAKTLSVRLSRDTGEMIYMMKKPLVSVIIPTYKRSQFLLDCIESVLSQDYKPIEIIVVDDNGIGTPFQVETEKILALYIDNEQIKYIPHTVNKNGSAARNTGFKFSKGDYVVFLDDDDTLLPSMVSSQVSRLSSLPEEYGATYCNSFIKYKIRFFKFIRRIRTRSKKEGNLCEEVLTGKCRFNTSTIMFRRSTIVALNGFDESFKRHQDYELLVRFFSVYKIGCTYQPLIEYDLTKDNTLRMDCKFDYDIKVFFFEKRGGLLKDMGIYEEVSHCLWQESAVRALLAGDMEYYKLFREKSHETQKDSVEDFLRIGVFKLLKRVKQWIN